MHKKLSSLFYPSINQSNLIVSRLDLTSHLWIYNAHQFFFFLWGNFPVFTFNTSKDYTNRDLVQRPRHINFSKSSRPSERLSVEHNCRWVQQLDRRGADYADQSIDASSDREQATRDSDMSWDPTKCATPPTNCHPALQNQNERLPAGSRQPCSLAAVTLPSTGHDTQPSSKPPRRAGAPSCEKPQTCRKRLRYWSPKPAKQAGTGGARS